MEHSEHSEPFAHSTLFFQNAARIFIKSPAMLLLASVVSVASLASVATSVASPPPGHGVCDFHNSSQLSDPGSKFTKPPVTAHSAQECCNICGADHECKGAELYGIGCYIKTKVLPIVPQKAPPGVPLVACVYQRWSPTPSPPGPPPGPLAPPPPAPPAPPPAPPAPPVPGPPGPPEGGGGPYFPHFHPRMHTAHNNDTDVNGYYYIFMQQSFPWVKDWNGAIGWGHMVSKDLAHWKEVMQTLLNMMDFVFKMMIFVLKVADLEQISSFTGYVDAFGRCTRNPHRTLICRDVSDTLPAVFSVPGRWHDPQYGVPAGGYCEYS